MAVVADNLKMAVVINELIMEMAVFKVKIIMSAGSFSLLSTCFRNSINPLKS